MSKVLLVDVEFPRGRAELAGTILSDDHPLVRSHPQLVAPASFSEPERAQLRRRALDRSPSAGRELPPLAVPFAGRVKPVRSFRTPDGRVVHSGERFDAGDPLVRGFAHMFQLDPRP